MVIKRHTELNVYKRSFDAAMRVFEITKTFPKDERYSLVDQIVDLLVRFVLTWQKRGENEDIKRRLSPNCPTARPKLRKHKSGFNSQLNVSISTAIPRKRFTQHEVIAMLVHIINHPNDWTIK